MTLPGSSFDAQNEGLTLEEAAKVCFRSRRRIYDLVRQHNLPTLKIWVPVPRAYPLERKILLLPPATMARLKQLTIFKVHAPYVPKHQRPPRRAYD